LVAAIVAFISEFVAIRIQQNKRKQERQEPFGEETLEIDDEICNDNATEKRLDNPAEVNGRSNMITTIAEVHSYDDVDIDQAASHLQVNDNEDSLSRMPENKLLGAFPKKAVRNGKQHAAIDLTEICQEICQDLESEEVNTRSNTVTTMMTTAIKSKINRRVYQGDEII